MSIEFLLLLYNFILGFRNNWEVKKPTERFVVQKPILANLDLKSTFILCYIILLLSLFLIQGAVAQVPETKAERVNWGMLGTIIGGLALLVTIGAMIYAFGSKMARFVTKKEVDTTVKEELSAIREEVNTVRGETNTRLDGIERELHQLNRKMDTVWEFYKCSKQTIFPHFLEQAMSSIFTSISSAESSSTNPGVPIGDDYKGMEDFLSSDEGKEIREILSSDETLEEKVIKVVNRAGIEKLKTLTNEKDIIRVMGKVALYIKNYPSSQTTTQETGGLCS